MSEANQPNTSKAWYLLPIFLTLLGGIIMFVALRKENPSMAKKGLILAIVLTVIGIIMMFALMGIGMMGSSMMDDPMMGGGLIPDFSPNEAGPFTDSTGYVPEWAMNLKPASASFECSDRYMAETITPKDDRWCMQLTEEMLSGLP